MKEVGVVFNKVLVNEFYRVNAGFFLLAAGLCFGFLSGVEHMALAHAFTSDSILFLIPVTLWVLYTLKIILFNSITLSRSENTFLFSSSGLPSLKLFSNLLLISTQQLIPVIAYGLFLASVAFTTHRLIAIIQIGATFILLITGVAIRLHLLILNPSLEIKTGFLRRKINQSFTKPLVWFYPEWITRRQPLLVFGTKVAACVLLITISNFYEYENYDERFLEMGSALTFSFNAVILFYYHRFENFHFNLIRGLPFPLLRRMLSFQITFVILMIPEFGVSIRYFPHELSIIHLFSILLFGISVAMLAYSYLFTRDMRLEKFIQWIGILTFLWIVLILFKIPLMIFTITHIITAAILYQKNYYQFEFNAVIDSEK